MPLTPPDHAPAGSSPRHTCPVLPARFYGIVLILFAGSVLNYLDRQTLSVLKPVIKSHFALDDQGYALLVNAFTFTYAVAYVGSGWFIERVGLRFGLFVAILGWSGATIGCGLSESFATLVAFRALLGVLEPAQFPAFVRAITLWAPPARRGTWMSFCSAGSSVGAIISVPVIAWLTAAYSWPYAFFVPGVLGTLLAGIWWFTYRDPAMIPAEVAARGASFTWPRLWRQRALWGLALARLISDPVWYFCLFWMPGYLQEVRGLTLKEAGIVGWIPFFAANVGGIILATLSDSLGRRHGGPARMRMRLLLAAAVLGPVTALTPFLPGLAATITVLSLVGIVCLGWLYMLGPLVSDIFPVGNVASVWAIAGAFGAVGAIVANFLIGHIGFGGGPWTFIVLGLLHPLAAVILYALVRQPAKSP